MVSLQTLALLHGGRDLRAASDFLAHIGIPAIDIEILVNRRAGILRRFLRHLDLEVARWVPEHLLSLARIGDRGGDIDFATAGRRLGHWSAGGQRSGAGSGSIMGILGNVV